MGVRECKGMYGVLSLIVLYPGREANGTKNSSLGPGMRRRI